MRIEINMRKEHFYFIVILIAVLFVVGVSAYDNPGIFGHSANETAPGTFFGTYTQWFTFPGNLKINNTLNISGNLTFENKAKITATQGLTINSTNVTITNNLTLGGVSKDIWPGTTIIAVHSQTNLIPDCPTGWDSLWAGYSFLQTGIGYYVHADADLGKSGSCMKIFRSTMPLECNGEGNTCSYVTLEDHDDWLVNTNSLPNPGVLITSNLESYLSRCRVCERPATAILVNHSQTTTVPSCPAGWSQLWNGYSFMLSSDQLFGGGYVNDQDPSSPGSCLQIFKATPFIECDTRGNPPNPICIYKSVGDYTAWLSATNTVLGPISDTGASDYVSRCVVCSK